MSLINLNRGITLLLAITIAGTTLGGTREVGNAGDAVSQDFVNIAKRLSAEIAAVQKLRDKGLDLKFEEAIKTVFVLSKDHVLLPSPDGTMTEFDAANYPKSSPPSIEVNRTRWNDPQMTNAKKRALVLHEYFGVLKLEQNRYFASAEILNILGDDPTTPKKLDEIALGEGLTGLTAESAAKRCAQQKALYRKDYWEVYCVFRSKNWTEIHWGVIYSKQYQFLGYVTEGSNFNARMYAYYANWSYASSGGAGGAVSASRFLTYPVIRKIYIPHSERYTVEKAVYGIEVYGIGPTAALSWKRVATSLNLANGLAPATFANEEEASLQCWEDLVGLAADSDTGFLYRKARCSTEMVIVDTDGKRRAIYVIETQNPFIR